MLGGLFDGVFDNLFDFSRSDRKLQRLIDQGETTTAQIDGVAIRHDGDATKHVYRLLTPDGQILGVRQMLRPRSAVARLGAEVVIRRLDERAVIDWPATLERAGTPDRNATIIGDAGVKPPERGIRDDLVNRKRIDKGTPAEAELRRAEPRLALGMPTEDFDLHVRIDGRDTVVKAHVPAYALYLLEPGTKLPVAVDPKRVTVDWVAAAERDYRV
jgi:hypothetical protein